MLKAIIFDVGGVLIRTQSRIRREQWAARLGMEYWDFENFVFSGESGLQAQLGQKSSDEHWRWLGNYFGLDETDLANMRRDFFADDAMNKPLVAYIKRLRRAGYRTGLLSNYNDEARSLWTTVYPFIQQFDTVIISAEVGLMKPDPRIYHLAVEQLGVKPKESLFIDDFIENVEAAQKIGLPAIHYTDPEAVQVQLAALTGVK